MPMVPLKAPLLLFPASRLFPDDMIVPPADGESPVSLSTMVELLTRTVAPFKEIMPVALPLTKTLSRSTVVVPPVPSARMFAKLVAKPLSLMAESRTITELPAVTDSPKLVFSDISTLLRVTWAWMELLAGATTIPFEADPLMRVFEMKTWTGFVDGSTLIPRGVNP